MRSTYYLNVKVLAICANEYVVNFFFFVSSELLDCIDYCLDF